MPLLRRPNKSVMVGVLLGCALVACKRARSTIEADRKDQEIKELVRLMDAEPDHVPDDELIRNFLLNHKSFEQVIEMFRADDHLVRIAMDFTFDRDDMNWPRQFSGLMDDRWRRYRQLFRETGAEGGLSRERDAPPVIFLIATSRGIVSRGNAKGYAWSLADLQPQVKSLDLAASNLKTTGVLYRSIAPNWYVFYEVL